MDGPFKSLFCFFQPRTVFILLPISPLTPQGPQIALQPYHVFSHPGSGIHRTFGTYRISPCQPFLGLIIGVVNQNQPCGIIQRPGMEPVTPKSKSGISFGPVRIRSINQAGKCCKKIRKIIPDKSQGPDRSFVVFP